MNANRRTLLAALAGLLALSAGAGAFFLRRPERQHVVRAKEPLRVDRSGETVFIDFGRTWFGNVVVVPDSRNSGSTVTLRLGEKLDADGRIDRVPFGTVRFYEVEAVLEGGRYSPPLTPADLRGMEDERPAMPFRYVEIEGWQGGMPAGTVTLEAVVAPEFAPLGRINFTGESETARQLNRLMELGERTMEATSFMGIFVDGDRERIPYEADGLINQLGWYATAGDWKVPRRTIEALFEKPTWPSEWMVQLVFMVWEDYRATGDRAFLGEVFDRLEIFSLRAFIDDTGLVTTVNETLAAALVEETGADYLEDIVDWPQVERDGYDMRPYNTVVNAFVCAGLQRMAAMAAELDRADDARAYESAADELHARIQESLIDGESGLFIDGVGSNHHAAHATFFPLAFDLVPQDRISAALDHLKARIAAYDGGFPCSVYGAQYLLDALFRNGEGETALWLMLNDSERGWLHMLDTYDATITHEAWDVRYKENIDWNHAWGAAFLNIAQRFILGAVMLEPRWARWTLRPDPHVDEPIQATIPTPHGIIDVVVDAAQRTIAIRSPRAAAFVPPSSTDGSVWTVAGLDLY